MSAIYRVAHSVHGIVCFSQCCTFSVKQKRILASEWSIIFLNEKTAVPPDSISIVCDCSNDVIFPSLFVPTINNWLMEFRIVYHNFNVFEYFSNNNKHKYKLLYQSIHTYIRNNFQGTNHLLSSSSSELFMRLFSW